MLGEFLTATKLAEIRHMARAQQTPWLQLDPAELNRFYNRLPFQVHHRLPEHPLFRLEELFKLCRRLPPDQLHFRFGKVPIDTHFDSSLFRYRQDLTLDDAINQLEARQAYIAIYNPERDPGYRPVIEGLLGELAQHTEVLDPGLNWYSTYIFISAKDSVTPYHMDREMNFLLQIRGSKIAQLWDPADDEVMSPAEKERLMMGRERPVYRPSLAGKAMVFPLEPGVGVHHPFIAPHIVHTGPELSISLAITFRTALSDVWSDAYRFNHKLRALGLNPGRVGASPWLDRGKAMGLRLARRALTGWRQTAPDDIGETRRSGAG